MTTGRVLPELRLKNWRSVREAVIDLTPITVFIGANSSGKSNILDALHFVRRTVEKDVSQAVFGWGGYSKVHSIFDILKEVLPQVA